MSSSSKRYDSDSSSSSYFSAKGNSDSEEEKERIGNTDWCVCGGKCPQWRRHRKFMLS